MPTISGASHVSFSVSDLPAALDWFHRVFDAEVMMHEPGEDRSAAVLTLPDTSLLVGLTQHSVRPGGPFDPAHTGLDHFAFAVADESALRSWADHLDAMGIANSGAVEVPPGAILNFKGPDDIALALFWRRSES